MKIDRNELLHYLGWRGQDIDAVISDSIDRMSELCMKVAAPRSVVRRFSYSDGVITDAGLQLEGNDVRRHLDGADEVYLIAATIGSGIERELERLNVKSRTDALIFDAAASCAIESYLDERTSELEKECARILLPRFSCGYGDFPITAQKSICALLNTHTRIGVCADDNNTLSPLKSVTAVIGILNEGVKRGACSSRCAICTKTDCIYRR